MFQQRPVGKSIQSVDLFSAQGIVLEDFFGKTLLQGLFPGMKFDVMAQIAALFYKFEGVGMGAPAVSQNGMQCKDARVMKNKILFLVQDNIAEAVA